MMRAVKVIIINICGLLALVGIFFSVAAIAGGFGTHTVDEKLLRSAIGFGSAISLLGIAFLISGRDTTAFIDNLLIVYLSHL